MNRKYYKPNCNSVLEILWDFEPIKRSLLLLSDIPNTHQNIFVGMNHLYPWVVKMKSAICYQL